jgi:hypothetical protein
MLWCNQFHRGVGAADSLNLMGARGWVDSHREEVNYFRE